MQTNNPHSPLETQWLLNADRHIKTLYEQRRYQEALDICLRIARTHPNMERAWSNAAVNCAILGRWQEAIDYAQIALARGCNTFALYDALAAAYGNLGRQEEARRYGLQALNIRARQYNAEPAIPWPKPEPMPLPPSAQTRAHNIIAFSLFGGDSKYCEPAVLNVLDQAQVYPHWVCRFYVDGSVPQHVIDRLRAGGAQIVRVEGSAQQWPGPMWRLLALNDPQVHRILFRDADSVISPREAAAVEQWIASGKRFHMMRDACTHTELILAGLWGVVAGSLPPLEQLMQRFISVPLELPRFADQFFLRQYVWPYARASLMQHDSVFGFMDAMPFPDKEKPESFYVGNPEGASFFTEKCNLPNGTDVTWVLEQIIEKRNDGRVRVKLICSYKNAVQDGVVKAHIPQRYAHWIQQGIAQVRLIGNSAAQRAASCVP